MVFRILNAVLYFLSGFVPRNRKKVLFGAWMGRRYADNPKYLMAYLAAHHPALDLVWCGHATVRPAVPSELPVRFVRHGSLKAIREMLTAGSCFVTHGFSDVGPFNLLRGARMTYVGHGLAIKRMGSEDRPLRNRALTVMRHMLRHAESFSHYVAVSAEHRRKLLVEYASNNVTPASILDIGQPRVDFLIDAVRTGQGERLRRRFFAEQKLPPVRTLIAYLPTFRDNTATVFSFTELTGELRARMETILETLNAVIVEKNHFRDAGVAAQSHHAQSARVIRFDETRDVDTQEILLATDLLITDYSGCYLDYLILDRPVIHFAYDQAYYAHSDRGLYFDLEAVAGGPIVEDIAELLDCIVSNLRNPHLERERRARIRQRLIEYERGVSSAELARMVGVEPMPHPPAPRRAAEPLG